MYDPIQEVPASVITSLAASISDTNTGTETAKFVTPDALAGSALGKKAFQFQVFAPGTTVTTGDGKYYFHVDSTLNGMNLVEVHAMVVTAGTTATTDIQIANVTDAVDMLSTKMTIDSTETGTNTAATPAVIDGTKDDVATNDVLRIDVDAVNTTPPAGLYITLVFQLP